MQKHRDNHTKSAAHTTMNRISFAPGEHAITPKDSKEGSNFRGPRRQLSKINMKFDKDDPFCNIFLTEHEKKKQQ